MLAELTDAANQPLTWANLGLAGFFMWAAFRGLVWLKPSVDQMKGDLDDLRAENRTLNTFLREAVIPALTEANALSRSSAEAINEAGELMRLLADELQRRQPRRGPS